MFVIERHPREDMIHKNTQTLRHGDKGNVISFTQKMMPLN